MLEVSHFPFGSVCPPGKTISDILENRKIGLSQFAVTSGLSLPCVKSLLEGKAAVDAEIANKLAESLGASPGFWLRREERYREYLKAAEAPLSECETMWLETLPVSNMKKLGWISNEKSKAATLIQCLRFFNFTAVPAWSDDAGSYYGTGTRFRSSSAYREQSASVAAWIRQGELEADFLDCAPWNKGKLINSLGDIRKLTLETDPCQFIPKLQNICSLAGVAVVIVKTPQGCRASGATKFVSPQKALLLLSFRYLSDDHFWFTVFHEIGHLVLHGQSGVFIETDNVENTTQEQEANEFSQSCLIPKNFAHQLGDLKNYRDILKFSKKIDVAPGVVVGQLQHQGHVKRNHFQRLKVYYRWEE